MKLSNGAMIYCFGEPNLFIMAGSHGEEKAPIIALEWLLEKKPKNVWVLPCLNIRGFKDDNRFYNGISTRDGVQETFNLNREYKPKTKLLFMQELQTIIRENKPEIFIDMHEHIAEESENDFIWSSLDNKDEETESKLRDFCRQYDVGITYQPIVKELKYSSDFFARRCGVLNA